MWTILLALFPCTVYRTFLSYLKLTHVDSPHFIWQISFVISRCYLVPRVGGGVSGVHQYYKTVTIFVGLNNGKVKKIKQSHYRPGEAQRAPAS